ncbi:Unknown protein sequence [Pseudomonas amygdali pv. lachrymans]|nr:Unknown protein sequence [Pseudomonas amygdali pv. lachrymans]
MSFLGKSGVGPGKKAGISKSRLGNFYGGPWGQSNDPFFALAAITQSDL